MTKRIQFLGVNIDTHNLSETVAQIEYHIQTRKPIHHVGVNADKINLMKQNEKFKKIINASPLVNPDGMSMVLAARILKKPTIERVAGIDVMIHLLKISAAKGYRVYFLGTSELILKKLLKKVQQDYPSLQIAGYHHGFFKQSEEAFVVEDIKKAKADILFVALPSPKKEYFIDYYMERMAVPVSMGVGGSFDVIAGEMKRAPMWMQRASLEWIYRMMQEPRRLAKRYIIGNIVFMSHVLREKKLKKSEVKSG
ncbi:WecB/TagA/CpsF family glycosyltransferase [Listeria booriae]|uniref:WecB/TagA/CpsF family glycosyltransferase n=1 Tax=Listeria booriae TaxID=1552123 RepID=UPI00162335F0|nr:WecB/TagA/CpsF family glycosyltransferase [Listeria booriae]MBC1287401.1 WecB/TagA/CpsF family glycosyltransferase [Listeria booriae]MBC2366426.1 WecB/TagA/CpsF family glycosyltransferase [Listeria booriae]